MKRIAAILMTLVLCLGLCISGYSEEAGELPDPESMPFVGGFGMTGLDSENFSIDDIPSEYLKACNLQGRVEAVSYPYGTEESGSSNAAMVYLPYGYDESEEEYNVLYLLHASNGTPEKFLNPERATSFQNLLDNMIANGRLQPLLVVAATYFPPEGNVQSMFLEKQVELVSMFPVELVNTIIPAVEQKYRTFAESTDTEGLTASRAHRGIAGFSLGGVATWNVFQKEMRCFRWFLPISEASWADAEGGTSGIWDSDVSAQVLYNAVLEQGYGKDDFRLFVATGTEDEAFTISTNQMISLLEYTEMFIPGDNTSCSLMAGGTHTTKAVYTYLYHILPALFRD